ncbi:MAG: hypothetical protein WC438_00560 [Candidatus Pacearchaeota archaeon]
MSQEDEKGKEAEIKFKEWLDKHKIPYLYIQQDKETFASAFKDFSGKRPDFMILIPNFGFIFVDIKYKKLNQEFKTYPIDFEETEKYSFLQRKFNLHVWFVISNEDFDYKTWLWIPVSKVLESGIKECKSSVSGKDFFPIPTNKFIQMANDDSLERLFSKILNEN